MSHPPVQTGPYESAAVDKTSTRVLVLKGMALSILALCAMGAPIVLYVAFASQAATMMKLANEHSERLEELQLAREQRILERQPGFCVELVRNLAKIEAKFPPRGVPPSRGSDATSRAAMCGLLPPVDATVGATDRWSCWETILLCYALAAQTVVLLTVLARIVWWQRPRAAAGRLGGAGDEQTQERVPSGEDAR